MLVLCLLVSTRFQVLFHSPPGVLFTVPSRYYTLSVTWSYLALRDGPRLFRQDSSCPAVLWILPPSEQFRLPGFYRLWLSFQSSSTTVLCGLWSPLPHEYCYSWFGLFRFRSPLLSESLFYFLFLRVIRCFSSPGSLHYAMYLRNDTITLLMVSSLIRISTDQSLFATPRSFSQLVTSFFGAMYQGILLCALCSLIFWLHFCNPSNLLFYFPRLYLLD